MSEVKYGLGEKVLIHMNGQNVHCEIQERVLMKSIDTNESEVLYKYTLPNNNTLHQLNQATLDLYKDVALRIDDINAEYN